MPTDSFRDILADLEDRAWAWFDANTHPDTGFVRDRCPSLEDLPPSGMSSIAATGYGLSLLPVRAETGRLDRARAEEQASRNLSSVRNLIPHSHGLCCHFVHWDTGARWERSEDSTLDTAILLNGCMVCAAYFECCRKPCAELLDRVDWSKVVVPDRAKGREILSYGIDPPRQPGQGGLVMPHGADRRSSENLMPYLLAAGAEHRPLDSRVYYNVQAEYGEVCGVRILNPGHALFTSYYGLAWADLVGMRDGDGIDYHANARLAAVANRAYCRAVAAARFRTYRMEEGGWWGLSAGDSPRGYDAKGPLVGDPDGMVWPTASVAALPWIEPELEQDLPAWRRSRVWPRVLGKFGLAPFTIDRAWVGVDIIGIDVGSLLLNLTNHQNGGLVRRLWMSHPVARRGIERLNFSSQA